MKNIVGIFRRKSPDHPWCRLMKIGTVKHMYSFYNMYPDHEVAMFEYSGTISSAFTHKMSETMRRVT